MTVPSVPVTQDVLTIPRTASGGLPNIIGLTRKALAAALLDAGTPERQVRMRVGQVWQWIYHWGVRDFDAMTNLARDYRALLARTFVIDLPEVVTRQVSADGTRKYLVRIAGGHEVEVVYIPETDRGTLCISSQVGCTLTCSFCHTGTQKLVRNLTAAEIVGQIMLARDDLGEWPVPGAPKDETRLLSNVVLMGMGEPLYNFENVRDAMRIAMDGEGLTLSRRRITLSTSGVVPEIARTAEEIGLPSRGQFPRHHRRDPGPTRSDQQAVEHRDPAGGAARLSEAVEFGADHLRIRHAEGRQRQRCRRPPPGQADPGHSSQDQPDPVQRVAGRTLPAFGTSPHQGLRRHHLQGRLRLAGPHTARRGHHGGLRAAEVGDRAGAEVEGRDFARGRAGLTQSVKGRGKPVGPRPG